MKKNRTPRRERRWGAPQPLTPSQRRTLGGELVATKLSLYDLAMQAGLRTLTAMLEEDRERLCGPKHKPERERRYSRYGYDRDSAVVLGGRKVSVTKPRVRDVEVGREVALPTWGLVTDEDPLERRALEQMLVGVSTRQYPRSLEPLPKGMESLSVSRSSVSRRFVSRTAAEVDAYLSRSLEGLDIPVVMIDGTGLGEHTLVVALGIDVQGRKHVLGARLGSTENETLGRELLSSLVERGLSLERARLFVIDGSKGLRKAIRGVFGEWALVQRCTVHKLRNVLDHLPEVDKVWVRTSLRRAWQSSDQAGAQRSLRNLAQQLEKRHPDAAASLREGLEETTTLLRLGVSSTASLYRTLCSTNAIENLQGLMKRAARNVKRWRDGAMVQRWAVAGLMEAEKRFRRIRGYEDLGKLVGALEAACVATQGTRRAPRAA